MVQLKVDSSEPEKCKELQFFSLDHLPTPLMESNISMFQELALGQFYSEKGFKTHLLTNQQ